MMKNGSPFATRRGSRALASRTGFRRPSALPACALGLGLAASAPGLDPALPPGGNFDLSHWKLTLPDATATEIPAALLVAGYSNGAYFFTGTNGAMVFWSPVTGGTTGDSSFPRSELRELLVSTDDNLNWTGHGTHTLDAQCQVLQVPSTKKVVIGQIHTFGGDASPLVKLQFANGLVEALVKPSPHSGADSNFPFMNVGLSNLISYRIQLADGWLTLNVNGSNRTVNVFQTDPAWAAQGFYFKAGSYCQDNAGVPQEGALVSFHELNVTHAGNTVLAHERMDSSGKFVFALLAYDTNVHAIQTSSNLLQWTDVFTNEAAGSFAFADTQPLPGPRRFYRARRFP